MSDTPPLPEAVMCGCWEAIYGPLQEQRTFLTPELLLQPSSVLFLMYGVLPAGL